ncbi:ABC transporter ATP-binding protein [Sporomusa malonica]|uniref:Peptide/nickel transport system ATP-binding protein n=1 Tax=Sporomusa malonica TaxID=112901 RepID=A0A1W2F512_9FIRM|nr:ATP-binding cassette domain-containing protein [Sporomusa malonica]SMD16606.1 peptide/nickel transport system ATP-binding protein [Sporomusa malonica]
MLLEANNIGYYYGTRQWVLSGVTIQIAAGEVVGLVGPSGYGKTTLGRILAGYETPCEGQVLLNGLSLPKVGYNPVQLVFQHPEKAVNPRWRMKETLNEGGEPDADIVKALGIQQSWLNRWPNELSGGELQRFCVARALTTKTHFLVADEMTTMLDAITQAQLWRVVLDFAKHNDIGILVISHEERLISRLCHKVIDLAAINKLQRSSA